MIKLNDIMTVSIAGKSASFTGREKFRVEDEAFKKQLVDLGTFAVQDDGTVRYVGDITITDKDGKDHKVDADGNIPIAKKDLDSKNRVAFI